MTSNFYLVLTDPDGLAGPGVQQMPGGVGRPYITDPGYKVTVNGTEMTGRQIQDALAGWLTDGFPK